MTLLVDPNLYFEINFNLDFSTQVKAVYIYANWQHAFILDLALDLDLQLISYEKQITIIEIIESNLMPICASILNLTWFNFQI